MEKHKVHSKKASIDVYIDDIEATDKRKRRLFLWVLGLVLVCGVSVFFLLGPIYFPQFYHSMLGKAWSPEGEVPEEVYAGTSSQVLKPQLRPEEEAVQPTSYTEALPVEYDDQPSERRDDRQARMSPKRELPRPSQADQAMPDSGRRVASSRAARNEAALNEAALKVAGKPESTISSVPQVESPVPEPEPSPVAESWEQSWPGKSLAAKESSNKPRAAAGSAERLQPLVAAARMPQFPGGEQAMFAYLNRLIAYPRQARDHEIEGTVYVQFVVEASGAITNPRVVKGLGYGCDEEALRIVNMMPRWTPGQQGARNVPVMYTLPVSFQFQ